MAKVRYITSKQTEMVQALTLVLMFLEELEDLFDSTVHACLSELQQHDH